MDFIYEIQDNFDMDFCSRFNVYSDGLFLLLESSLFYNKDSKMNNQINIKIFWSELNIMAYEPIFAVV